MRIAIFTSNQPRHLHLIEGLASIADELYVIQESETIYPGQVQSFFRASDTMRRYFSLVHFAEKKRFGSLRFLPKNCRSLTVHPGDLRKMTISDLGPASEADLFVIYGTGLIGGELLSHPINHSAYNIHMGAAPWYRGASCNFWALQDRRPDMVMGTVHLLSSKVDHGAILFQAVPDIYPYDAFDLGMATVEATLKAFITNLIAGALFSEPPKAPLEEGIIRICKNADFTDEVAESFICNPMTPADIQACLSERELSHLIRPLVIPVRHTF